MTYILYNKDHTIKTFMDFIADVHLEEGETFSVTSDTFVQYAALFVLSHAGVPCMTVYAKVGDPAVVIDVSAPGNAEVSVDVNNSAQVVTLTDGKGSLTLPTDTAGNYLVAPTDRQAFCSAGTGSILVIVIV